MCVKKKEDYLDGPFFDPLADHKAMVGRQLERGPPLIRCGADNSRHHTDRSRLRLSNTRAELNPSNHFDVGNGKKYRRRSSVTAAAISPTTQNKIRSFQFLPHQGLLFLYLSPSETLIWVSSVSSTFYPDSFFAILATCSPWKRAPASSLSLGDRLPSAPAMVEAP